MGLASIPIKNKDGFYEIRMESIGGLGANLAGKMLGEAVVLKMGYNGSNFSSYGSEKKGTPIKSFVRLCDPDQEIRVNSPIMEPHLIAIFHENLVKMANPMQGVGPDAAVVLNTARSPEDGRDLLKMRAGTIFCVDAMKIAVEEKTRINTAVLGAICRASGFLDANAVKDQIRDTLGHKYPKLVEPNIKTFDRGFNEVKTKKFVADGKYPMIPFERGNQKIGYKNQYIGGLLPFSGTTIGKDLSGMRSGTVPVLDKAKCIHCAECEITCPDYCFVWVDGKDKKGNPTRLLDKINYQFCKGCLRCVEICKPHALTSELESKTDPEILKQGHK